MKLLQSPLVAALREPARMAGFDAAEWTLAIRQARSAGLLGRLGVLALERGAAPDAPPAVARHLRAMMSVADKQAGAVHWEARHLSRAVGSRGVPVVLLKGAAYAAAGLPAAVGRTFTDIDILVAKDQLPEAERLLFVGGWTTGSLDPYDERYYRRWMHELPPMQHLVRGTPLDVHHNILPETARIRTRPDLILAAAEPLPGCAGLFIPSRHDQILHSATHLFHEGEWEHGLRDLSDLDLLLRAYAASDAGFWTGLLARARALHLERPLHYALRYAAAVLQTPVPQTVLQALPGGPLSPLMDALFMNGFSSAHASCRGPWTGLAQFFLYVRSHWLRMPVHLLAPHLLHQALRRETVD